MVTVEVIYIHYSSGDLLRGNSVIVAIILSL